MLCLVHQCQAADTEAEDSVEQSDAEVPEHIAQLRFFELAFVSDMVLCKVLSMLNLSMSVETCCCWPKDLPEEEEEEESPAKALDQ